MVQAQVGELAHTEPALETLRTLAGETGGMLLAQEPPATWQSPAETEKDSKPGIVVSERRHPEWDNWTMLLLAVGFYAGELILRHIWKLL